GLPPRRPQRLGAARPDKQVRRQARRRRRAEMQPPQAAPDQRARRRHRDARLLARHGEHAAVADGRERLLEGADEHSSAGRLAVSSKANWRTLAGVPVEVHYLATVRDRRPRSFTSPPPPPPPPPPRPPPPSPPTRAALPSPPPRGGGGWGGAPARALGGGGRRRESKPAKIARHRSDSRVLRLVVRPPHPDPLPASGERERRGA